MTTSSSPQQPAAPPTESHYIIPEWKAAVDPDQIAKALVLIAEDIHQVKDQKSKAKHKTRPTKPQKGGAT